MPSSNPNTPVMLQYREIKERYPDSILFFRLGDFYEMFFEDAKVAAAALDLTLTSRDKNKENPVPMCGVPHHAGRNYLRRLVDMGHKVAVCEQVEDPKLARGVVKREVTEVVTPGVVVDTEQLDARSNNYLVALWPNVSKGRFGLAALDLSTFELRLTEVEGHGAVVDELARLHAKETVYAQGAARGVKALEQQMGGFWQALDDELVLSEAKARRLLEEKSQLPLDQLSLGPLVLKAAGLALAYAEETQPGRGVPRCRVSVYRAADHLQLDEATIHNLEVFLSAMERRREGSLLAVVDETCTAMGARLLRRWLAMPLLDVAAIRRRQDAVELLLEQASSREVLREALRHVYDLERLTARAVLQVATPRELARLGSSLARLPALWDVLEKARGKALSRELPKLLRWPEDTLADVAERLAAALSDEPPPHMRDGGIFRRGFSGPLDELIELAEGGKALILEMEAQLRERTGISSLKIRFNKVFGYFIEVTKANISRVPEEFQRKQTLVNAERYVTPQLADYESKVLGAQERRVQLEQELFTELREEVALHAARLTACAERVASVDVFAGLAQLAEEHGYVRPAVDDSRKIELRGGRHPVVERYMAAGEFIPNDILMDAEGARMLVLTGPNMSGKSTVMRQVAQIVLLAQLGSFVPCDEARIGVVDRIFTRVGASDNLARGESTFMVEMKETSTILEHATARSLVVLDEIGRGTSTYDGISIAWSVAEYLHDEVQARCLFATHYHELCQLETVKDYARNVQVDVREWQGRVVFLHKLVAGSSSRSYGIEVARLAGLPRRVLDRAHQALAVLEGREEVPGIPLRGYGRSDQLDLFAAPPASSLGDPADPPCRSSHVPCRSHAHVIPCRSHAHVIPCRSHVHVIPCRSHVHVIPCRSHVHVIPAKAGIQRKPGTSLFRVTRAGCSSAVGARPHDPPRGAQRLGVVGGWPGRLVFCLTNIEPASRRAPSTRPRVLGPTSTTS